MNITVLLVLALIALALTIATAVGRAPLWWAVLVLAIIALLHEIPIK